MRNLLRASDSLLTFTACLISHTGNIGAKLEGRKRCRWCPVKTHQLKFIVSPGDIDFPPLMYNIATPHMYNIATPLVYNIATPLMYNTATPLMYNTATPLVYNIATPLMYNIPTPLMYNIATPLTCTGR